MGGAGGAGVNVRPAPAALTQFHQKLEEEEEAAALPRTLSRAEAGRDLRRLHPVHLRRWVARAVGRRRPSGLGACLAAVRSVSGYASS